MVSDEESPGEKQHNTPLSEQKNAFFIYHDVESFTPKTPTVKGRTLSSHSEFVDNQLAQEDKENVNPFTKERVPACTANYNQSTMPLRDVTCIYQDADCSKPNTIPLPDEQNKSPRKVKTRKIR